jgi:hypothetical protein
MIVFLTLLLATMSATLLVTQHRRGQRAQVAAEIPPGYKIHAADLGHVETMGSKGRLLLVDNEWGLCGAPDLLLDGPEDVVPVEMKRVWKRYQCKRDDGQSLGRLLVLPGGDYADYTPGLVEWQEISDSAGSSRTAPGRPTRRPGSRSSGQS